MSSQHAKNLKALTLSTNQFLVSLPGSLKVFIYSLSFLPSIPSDNSKMKKFLVNKSRSDLSKYLEGFIHCGENIYSTKEIFTGIKEQGDETSSSERPEFFKFLIEHDGICYEGSLVPCGSLEFNGETIRDERALQVLNISLRNKLKLLRFVQFGTYRNHYNSLDNKPVRGFPAEIWPGFFTSINKLKGGLMLTIDSSFKLLRTDSVLEVISDLLHRHKQNKNKVRSLLKNSIIMTFYGSQNVYRIDDILFEENPLDPFPDESKAKNYLQYFHNVYQAAIKFKSQPLILARRSLKDSPVRLVPELCRMTGPESLGNTLKLKKAVSEITRLNPNEKLEKICCLAEQLQQQHDPKWQMINSANPVTVNAKQLPYPEVLTNNQIWKVTEKSVFNLKKFSPVRSQPCSKWMLFCCEGLKGLAEDLIKGLKSASGFMSQELKDPLKVCIPNSEDNSRLRGFLMSKLRSEAQLVVFLVPKNSSIYALIKSVLTKDFPIVSQVVTDYSVEKNDPSIYLKLYTQILCKIGGIPWTVKLPSLPRYTMIVGIDVCHNSFTAKQSVLGFWASLNASCTKGYSKAVFHGVNQEISDILTPVFNESINKFIEVNSGHKPECIVVYRDGVGKSQYEKVVNFEIPQVVAAIKEIDSQWNPQIVVMGVNKRVNQRFFLNGRNPGHGLVVNEGVVLDNANFYLISHFSTIGCITPTHYHVVVNESNIDEQILYQLTYDLCYLYFNWQGGIRVPAPCMYAHKIAYLVGKHTGVLVDSDLLQSFFFL